MSTVQFLNTTQLAARRNRPGAGNGVFARVGRAWRAWVKARRTVRAGRYLIQMDEHMLKDIGVSRAQAVFMASRPELGVRWHDDA